MQRPGVGPSSRPASGRPQASSGTPREAEPEQLLATLRGIIQFIGEVYAEASGHTAAAQRVVGDLRRSLAYLNSRREAAASGEPPIDAAASGPTPSALLQRAGSNTPQPPSPTGNPTVPTPAAGHASGSPAQRADGSSGMARAPAPAAASGSGVSAAAARMGTGRALLGPSASRTPGGGRAAGATNLPAQGQGLLGRQGSVGAAGAASGMSRPGATTTSGTGAGGRGPTAAGGARQGAAAAGRSTAGLSQGGSVGAGRSASTGRARPVPASGAAPGASQRQQQAAAAGGRSGTPEPKPRPGGAPAVGAAASRAAPASAGEAQPLGSTSAAAAAAEVSGPGRSARPAQASSAPPLQGRPSGQAAAQPVSNRGSGQGQGPSSSWPPHMPPHWRRAVKQYEEALTSARLSALPLNPRDTAAVGGAGGSSTPGAPGTPSSQPTPVDGAGAHGPLQEVAASLSSSVTFAAQGYATRLQEYSSMLQQGQEGGPGGAAAAAGSGSGPGAPTPGGTSGPVRADWEDPGRTAQAAFTAVIAAQTWVLNALRQAMQSLPPATGRGGLSSAAGQAQAAAQVSALGVSAEGLHQLLLELRVARMQVADAMDERRQKGSAQGRGDWDQGAVGGGAAGGAGVGGVGSGGSGGSRPVSAKAAAGGVGAWPPVLGTSASPVLPGEAVQAALRWRNRFLRAMTTPLQQQQQQQQQQGVRPGQRGGRGGAAGGRNSQLNNHPTPPAAGAASLQPMPRPLGLWLPHHCWQLATTTVLAGPFLLSPSSAPSPGASPFGPGASPGTPSPLPATRLSLSPGLSPNPNPSSQPGAHPPTHPAEVGALAVAPWLLALPQAVRAHPTPAVLLCGSLVHAISHGRAQQQLQQCLLQLHLEGTVATPLLPFGPLALPHSSGGTEGVSGASRPGSAAGGGVGAGGGGCGANAHARWLVGQRRRAEERYLARLRLAHSFLVKGSWNRRCYLVEPRAERGQEEVTHPGQEEAGAGGDERKPAGY